MKIALAGRPGSGKSAFFDLLASARLGQVGAGAAAGRAASRPEESSRSRKGGVRIVHAEVPDPRVLQLSAAYRPRKTTPARLQFEDLEQPSAPAYPALSSERRDLLSRADLILLVLDLFTEPGEDPAESARRQWNQAWDEYVLSDLAVVESRLEKLRKLLRIGQKPNFPGELELLELIRDSLESGLGILQMNLEEERLERIKGFNFITARPVLPACNLAEDQLASLSGLRPVLHAALSAEGDRESLLLFSAEVERQILDLPPEERLPLMELFGLESPALDQVIRSVYRVAGLICFFTVGDDEVRAWSVSRDASAVDAADVIHSDLARGFVAAEVLAYADYEVHGSYEAARTHGSCRLEGKGYRVQDGDVINFRSGLAKAGR